MWEFPQPSRLILVSGLGYTLASCRIFSTVPLVWLPFLGNQRHPIKIIGNNTIQPISIPRLLSFSIYIGHDMNSCQIFSYRFRKFYKFHQLSRSKRVRRSPDTIPKIVSFTFQPTCPRKSNEASPRVFPNQPPLRTLEELPRFTSTIESWPTRPGRVP